MTARIPYPWGRTLAIAAAFAALWPLDHVLHLPRWAWALTYGTVAALITLGWDVARRRRARRTPQ